MGIIKSKGPPLRVKPDISPSSKPYSNKKETIKNERKITDLKPSKQKQKQNRIFSQKIQKIIKSKPAKIKKNLAIKSDKINIKRKTVVPSLKQPKSVLKTSAKNIKELKHQKRVKIVERGEPTLTAKYEENKEVPIKHLIHPQTQQQ